jgi:hypothetical protein
MDAESPSSPANKNQTSKANNSTDPSSPTSSPKRKSAQRKLPFTPPRSTTENTASPQKSPRKSRSKKARAQQAQENFNSDQWIPSRRRTETAPSNTSVPAQLPLPSDNGKFTTKLYWRSIVITYVFFWQKSTKLYCRYNVNTIVANQGVLTLYLQYNYVDFLRYLISCYNHLIHSRSSNKTVKSTTATASDRRGISRAATNVSPNQSCTATIFSAVRSSQRNYFHRAIGLCNHATTDQRVFAISVSTKVAQQSADKVCQNAWR